MSASVHCSQQQRQTDAGVRLNRAAHAHIGASAARARARRCSMSSWDSFTTCRKQRFGCVCVCVCRPESSVFMAAAAAASFKLAHCQCRCLSNFTSMCDANARTRAFVCASTEHRPPSSSPPPPLCNLLALESHSATGSGHCARRPAGHIIRAHVSNKCATSEHCSICSCRFALRRARAIGDILFHLISHF